MEKVRIVEEVRYDTVQVCDSLEQAQSLIEETPWREIRPVSIGGVREEKALPGLL